MRRTGFNDEALAWVKTLTFPKAAPLPLPPADPAPPTLPPPPATQAKRPAPSDTTRPSQASKRTHQSDEPEVTRIVTNIPFTGPQDSILTRAHPDTQGFQWAANNCHLIAFLECLYTSLEMTDKLKEALDIRYHSVEGTPDYLLSDAMAAVYEKRSSDAIATAVNKFWSAVYVQGHISEDVGSFVAGTHWPVAVAKTCPAWGHFFVIEYDVEYDCSNVNCPHSGKGRSTRKVAYLAYPNLHGTEFTTVHPVRGRADVLSTDWQELTPAGRPCIGTYRKQPCGARCGQCDTCLGNKVCGGLVVRHAQRATRLPPVLIFQMEESGAGYNHSVRTLLGSHSVGWGGTYNFTGVTLYSASHFESLTWGYHGVRHGSTGRLREVEDQDNSVLQVEDGYLNRIQTRFKGRIGTGGGTGGQMYNTSLYMFARFDWNR